VQRSDSWQMRAAVTQLPSFLAIINVPFLWNHCVLFDCEAKSEDSDDSSGSKVKE
jgi:hypothetical protein